MCQTPVPDVGFVGWVRGILVRRIIPVGLPNHRQHEQKNQYSNAVTNSFHVSQNVEGGPASMSGASV